MDDAAQTTDAFYPEGRGFRDFLVEARRPGNTWSHGIGFRYFGRRPIPNDRTSWTTTKWFVVADLPIWPIETVRIGRTDWLRARHGWFGKFWKLTFTTTRLDEPIVRTAIEPRPLDQSQILRTVLHYWGGAAGIVIIGWLLGP